VVMELGDATRSLGVLEPQRQSAFHVISRRA
jgi:hypothetical protein